MTCGINKEAHNNCFNQIIAFVTICAVATLLMHKSRQSLASLGPQLQVKQMLGGRLRRPVEKEEILKNIISLNRVE
jgi:hypothetical protein